jgi:uncharacterized membrane protein
VSVMRSGPLPPPSELQEFEKISPGAAARIIEMAEREQAHRHRMEELSTQADIEHRDELARNQLATAKGVLSSDRLGQILGFVIATFATAGCIFTAYIQANATVSIALVSMPIIGIIKAVRASRDSKESAKR